MKFRKIAVCLDMYGCPNRCKHCWIGHSPNGKLDVSELDFVAGTFRPFSEKLTVYDWYREPDYHDDYPALWDRCISLSDEHEPHFELASVWRLVRDPEYGKWLAEQGLRACQLTLFGGEEKTDWYTGRKNAYREILQAIDILLANRIAPRIQFFVNKETIGELPHIEKLILEQKLEERCRAFGGEFSFFLHQGSCDGENEKRYDIRVTPEDLHSIPESLAAYTRKHFGVDTLGEVFGKTEAELYEELRGDDSVESYVTDAPVFYIDKDFNVYPNITAPADFWCLGNLKTDGAAGVLEHYLKSSSTAQHVRLTVPVSALVKAQGDPSSQRLFDREDYIGYLLNRYCRDLGSDKHI